MNGESHRSMNTSSTENIGKPTSRTWVFMDAGDTFIYAYPTFYEALRDCWRCEGEDLSLMRIREAVVRYSSNHPRFDQTTQDRFRDYFRGMYRGVLEALSFPGDIDRSVDWLWDEWLSGERLRLFDDAHPALRMLRQAGFGLGVISNWDRTFKAVLNRLGVADDFEVQIGSCDVGLAKPDPRIFRHALSMVQAVPGQSWYLGDRLEPDIQPAKALGMRTIYVDYYENGGGDEIADYTAPSLSVAATIVCQEEKRNNRELDSNRKKSK